MASEYTTKARPSVGLGPARQLVDGVYMGPEFGRRLSDVLIRIYALDPQNYSINEAHVKEEFEKISRAAASAGVRMADMEAALRRLAETVGDLELQMARTKPMIHVIEEEPDVEELLS